MIAGEDADDFAHIRLPRQRDRARRQIVRPRQIEKRRQQFEFADLPRSDDLRNAERLQPRQGGFLAPIDECDGDVRGAEIDADEVATHSEPCISMNMAKIVLGLDIGGANLKAATSAGRALSVPFAVWKQPEKLSGELRKLIAQFPEAEEIAATMTAELCDCYETKREGVRCIIDDLKIAANELPIRIWSTEGKFVSPQVAIANHMKVAAANWHALAIFTSRFVPNSPALLIDFGSTTTDLIPMLDGKIHPMGYTDIERLECGELIYTGWRRTPATSLLMAYQYATELFATTLDAYICLGLVPESPLDYNTANGKPATIVHSRARLARMLCGDTETLTKRRITYIAKAIKEKQTELINLRIHQTRSRFSEADRIFGGITAILSGSGAQIMRTIIREKDFKVITMLESIIGHPLSVSGPAYAVATLAAERRP